MPKVHTAKLRADCPNCQGGGCPTCSGFGYINDGKTAHYVWCPGCKQYHSFDARWQYNGDPEKPTFTPSLLVFPNNQELRCHSFVTDGKWHFLSDCHHALAGQTVNMEEVNF